MKRVTVVTREVYLIDRIDNDPAEELAIDDQEYEDKWQEDRYVETVEDL